MRYLVFSDVHGNLPALEAVLEKEKEVSGYINLGDVVNYGPWSNECVELIDSLENCTNIVGNHEDYFISGNCPVENPLVQAFFEKTFSGFKQSEKIRKYEERKIFNDFLLIHTLGEKNYVFRDSQVDLQDNSLIGHSHQQYIRYLNGFFLGNPGSVGQNRKFINLSNYMIWNMESGEFQMKSMPYNLDYLLTEMEKQEYPVECIDYYKNKKRYQ